MGEELHGLRRERRDWELGASPSQDACPLCDGPAAVKEVRGPEGPVYRLLVLCDSCSIFHLTTSAEYVLRRRPNGRAVLADRARRTFATTGLPMEVDVEAVERVAQFFRE
jgi:hypothetical protein